MDTCETSPSSYDVTTSELTTGALSEANNMILESEFACVELTLDYSGNGPTLRVQDLRSGAVTFLDALLLESLVWASPIQLDGLVDPGWRWGSSLPIHDPAGLHAPPLSGAQL